jgi:hypothetical protein
MSISNVKGRRHPLLQGEAYVGRRSGKWGSGGEWGSPKWGNPFVVGRDGDRDECCEKYATWFLEQSDLLADLGELRGRILLCWCAPQRCHAEILEELANK